LAEDGVADCPDVKPGELFETRTAYIPPGPPVEYVGEWSRSAAPFLPLKSGDYTVLPTSYRDPVGFDTEYDLNNQVTLISLSPGVYELSDMWGGYYVIGRGYDANDAKMHPNGRLKFDGANFSLIDADPDYWGYGFNSVTGTYDETTKAISIEVTWGGYIFYLDMISNDD